MQSFPERIQASNRPAERGDSGLRNSDVAACIATSAIH